MGEASGRAAALAGLPPAPRTPPSGSATEPRAGGMASAGADASAAAAASRTPASSNSSGATRPQAAGNAAQPEQPRQRGIFGFLSETVGSSLMNDLSEFAATVASAPSTLLADDQDGLTAAPVDEVEAEAAIAKQDAKRLREANQRREVPLAFMADDQPLGQVASTLQSGVASLFGGVKSLIAMSDDQEQEQAHHHRQDQRDQQAPLSLSELAGGNIKPAAAHDLGARLVRDRRQQRLFTLQTDPGTYCTDCTDDPGYADWQADFDIEAQTEAISALLADVPEIQAFHGRLVPQVVSYLVFWQRYFFRVHLLEAEEARRTRLVQTVVTDAHDEDDDDDFGWDDSVVPTAATDSLPTAADALPTAADTLPTATDALPTAATTAATSDATDATASAIDAAAATAVPTAMIDTAAAGTDASTAVSTATTDAACAGATAVKTTATSSPAASASQQPSASAPASASDDVAPAFAASAPKATSQPSGATVMPGVETSAPTAVAVMEPRSPSWTNVIEDYDAAASPSGAVATPITTSATGSAGGRAAPAASPAPATPATQHSSVVPPASSERKAPKLQLVDEDDDDDDWGDWD